MSNAVRHVPAALCEIEAGRTPLGIAYASLVVAVRSCRPLVH